MAVTAMFCILCGLSSHAQPQSSDDQTYNTISGTVINSVTHEPIGRAMVYTADDRAAAFTDDHGNFELSVPGGPQPTRGGGGGGGGGGQIPMQLQARKPGF